MAVQTKLYTRISGPSGLEVECFMEYEDTDYQEINDDGDPDDFRVIRWFGTNHHTLPLIVTLERASGQNWVSRTISAGADFSQNAGGAVRYESDIPQWYWGWVD